MKQQTMKYTLLAFATATSFSHAANLAVGGSLASDVTVASGDWWQGNSLTTTIGTGRTLAVTNATFDTIVQQNATGTSTINVNTGGILDFSSASGAGASLIFGNNVNDALGIIDVNGGTFDGSGLTSIILGRDQGDGELNISAGTVSLGAIPTLSNNVNSTGVINFDGVGNSGSLTITGADKTYYEGLFAAGELQRNGSSAGSFDSVFSVSGSTITAVPEPSSVALLGLGSLALILRRRK